jgi:cell division protein FtsB
VDKIEQQIKDLEAAGQEMSKEIKTQLSDEIAKMKKER